MVSLSFPLRVVLLSLSSACGVFTLTMLFLCRKRTPVCTGRTEFFAEVLFPIGGTVNGMLRIPDRKERERIEKLRELVPRPEACEIARNAGEAPMTYVLLLFPPLLALFAMTQNLLLFVTGMVAIGFLGMYFDWSLDRTLRLRHEQILAEYPAMLTDLSLMVHAGITANAAFEKVADASDGILYQEMQKCARNMQQGMSVAEALDGLILHCPLREVKKFVSLYKQNLIKGGPDFPRSLDEMAEAAWTARKNAAKEQGELAEQKLLIPTIFMFVGILLMVIVPALRSLFL